MFDQIICSIFCMTVQTKNIHETKTVPNESSSVHSVDERAASHQVVPSPPVANKNNRTASGNSNPPKVTNNVRANNSNAAGVGSSVVHEQINLVFGSDAEAARELYFRESGLNPTAVNKSSGASGLVQALPRSKLPCELSHSTEAIRCQLEWGRAYNARRYGGTRQALAFQKRMGWY